MNSAALDMATSLQAVQVVGVGSALPDPVLTNDHLSQLVDTSDEWIWPRTGIRQRRILPPEQSLLDLAARAAQQALDQAELVPLDIDLIILATSTSPDRFGSAPQLQALLGASRAIAFDLSAACTGFVFALATAAQFLQTGLYRRALVVAADVLSRTVDWQDRTTCILFGDGAGAMILETADVSGLLGLELRTDGSGTELLTLPLATQPRPLVGDLQVGEYECLPIGMNGREVYKFAVTAVPEVIEKVLFRTGLSAQEIQGFFIHQANQRILDAIVKRLEVDPERVISVLQHYGNTSGASVPIALADALAAGSFAPGHLGVMAGFGAGLSWGAIVFRWGRHTP
ncbi:MAG: beta-ketoacyl-ACP synthase III [Cyanobacteriota bacterium]|nr:beta-ketoacyl-ACP synthase III [Cyanobacteriota bacterium]